MLLDEERAHDGVTSIGHAAQDDKRAHSDIEPGEIDDDAAVGDEDERCRTALMCRIAVEYKDVTASPRRSSR